MLRLGIFPPERLRYDLDGWAEVVVGRHGEADEEHHQPDDVQDHLAQHQHGDQFPQPNAHREGKKTMARSTVDHGDVVDEAVHVLAVVVVLNKIAPGGNSHVRTRKGLADRSAIAVSGPTEHCTIFHFPFVRPPSQA